MKWNFYKRLTDEEKEELKWINKEDGSALMLFSHIFLGLGLNCVILFRLGSKDEVAVIGGLFIVAAILLFMLSIVYYIINSFRNNSLTKRVKKRLNKEEFDQALNSPIPMFNPDWNASMEQPVVEMPVEEPSAPPQPEPEVKIELATKPKRGRKPIQQGG